MIIIRVAPPWREAAMPLFDPTGGFLTAGLTAAASLAQGGMGMVGALGEAKGQKAAALASAEAARYRAEQIDMQADEARASSQREALEVQRNANQLSSKLRANAAASGAGASDPGVAKLEEDVAGRGAYQALMDMYGGENRARGLEDEADGLRLSGESAIQGARYSARGTILSGLGGLAGSIGSAAAGFRNVDWRLSRNRLPGSSYG